MVFCWAMTLLGAIAGGLTFFLTFTTAKSAPQEAAGFAMAVAFVVIPYVFTRAAEGLANGNWQHKLVDAVEESGRKIQASVTAAVGQRPSQPVPSNPQGPAAAAPAWSAPPPIAPAASAHYRTTQQCIEALQAAGFKVKTHQGGWEIAGANNLKHYAYNDNDLNKWANRYAPAGS